MTRRVSCIRRARVTTAQLEANLKLLDEWKAQQEAEALKRNDDAEKTVGIAANQHIDQGTPVTDTLKTDLNRDVKELRKLLDESEARNGC